MIVLLLSPLLHSYLPITKQLLIRELGVAVYFRLFWGAFEFFFMSKSVLSPVSPITFLCGAQKNLAYLAAAGLSHKETATVCFGVG